MARRTYRYFTGRPLFPFGYGLSYTRFGYSRADAPIRALCGFQRVHLKPGEERVVSLALTPDAFAVVDRDGKRRVVAGTVNLWIGGGQPAADGSVAGVATRLQVRGDAVLGA